VTNQATSQSIQATVGVEGSDRAGWYQVDLSTLPQKYTEGDLITISVTGTGDHEGWTGEKTISIDRSTNIIQWVNITLTQMDEELPSAPLNPRATPGITDGIYYIILYWAEPLTTGGSSILSYTIYRGDTLGQETVYQEAVTDTQFNDTGLLPQKTFYYRISAVSSQGEGILSPPLKGSTHFPPHAHFSFSPQDPHLNDSIYFVDHSTDKDGSIINWTWNLGEDITRYGEEIHYTFPEPGTYTIQLLVTDNHGDQGTSTQTLSITTTDGKDTPGFQVPLLLLSLSLLMIFLWKKHPA
jgi:chitodextrinase